MYHLSTRLQYCRPTFHTLKAQPAPFPPLQKAPIPVLSPTRVRALARHHVQCLCGHLYHSLRQQAVHTNSCSCTWTPAVRFSSILQRSPSSVESMWMCGDAAETSRLPPCRHLLCTPSWVVPTCSPAEPHAYITHVSLHRRTQRSTLSPQRVTVGQARHGLGCIRGHVEMAA